MLKRAMRIVAVGGALLAMAVGTAAWMHRTQGRIWEVATPAVCSTIILSPQYLLVDGWLRSESDPVDWHIGRYAIFSTAFDNAYINASFDPAAQEVDFGKKWHGFGFERGSGALNPIRSYTAVLCPTWAVVTVLLLPMGLWAGIGWRQRRRVAAGALCELRV